MVEKEINSVYIIGNVKEHYKNVFREDRRWDVWRAFYNGWLDGRSKMSSDLIDAYKQIKSQQQKIKQLEEENKGLNGLLTTQNEEAVEILTDKALKSTENAKLKQQIIDITAADQSYSLIHIIEKLSEASNILLHEKNYDGHGWELIEHCIEKGKEVIQVIKNKNK